MNSFKKALVGTAAATAMAVSATPAMANDSQRKGGPSAGEVVAGAVILGGLAAILTSGKKDRYNRGDRYRGGRNYNNGYRDGRYRGGHHNDRGYGYDRIKPRTAIKKCTRAAERRAGHNANVIDIRDVKRTRYGYKIKGRIAMNSNYRAKGHGGRYSRSNYDRGYSGYKTGKFTCYVEGRQVTDVRLKGLRH